MIITSLEITQRVGRRRGVTMGRWMTMENTHNFSHPFCWYWNRFQRTFCRYWNTFQRMPRTFCFGRCALTRKIPITFARHLDARRRVDGRVNVNKSNSRIPVTAKFCLAQYGDSPFKIHVNFASFRLFHYLGIFKHLCFVAMFFESREVRSTYCVPNRVIGTS